MKRMTILVLGVVCITIQAICNTWYVDASRPDNSGDGTSWSTAKQTIQAAVDAASVSDTVLVTNGVYDTGTTVTPGYSCLNRVVITNDISVQSVNGPDVTLIVGAKDNVGTNSVRGVYLAAGFLSGFTVTNAATWLQQLEGDACYDFSGGGLLIEAGTQVSNCVITGCFAGQYHFGDGGGLYCNGGGTVNNCVIKGNRAPGGQYEAGGGGCHGGTLNDCTLSGNTAAQGGGSSQATLNRCTICENAAKNGGGCANCTLNDCVLSGNRADVAGDMSGGGSLDSTLNRCVLFNNYAEEYGSGAYGGTLRSCLLYANDSLGTLFGATLINCTVTENIGGPAGISTTFRNCIIYNNSGAPFNSWLNACYTDDPLFVNAAAHDFHLLSTSPCINAGSNELVQGSTDLDSNPRIMGSAVDMGAYEMIGEHTGISPMHYVSPDGGNLWPYTNWTDAATCIQDAVETAMAGDIVLVTNGVYDTGGALALSFELVNRVGITKDVLVKSVNGPDFTFIVGASDAGTNGPAAMRGVMMNSGTLSGFTITNGYTLASSSQSHDMRGGGILCYYGSPVVSNCVVVGNTAETGGGGILLGGGTPLVINCEIRGNTCAGSGADAGGLWFFNGAGTARNCLIIGNEAVDTGGGVLFGSTATDCTLENCTVVANSAVTGGGVRMWNGTVRNCIVYENSASGSGNNWSWADNTPNIEYSCITPLSGLPGGTGCTDGDPLFIGGGAYRLLAASPCINTGNNQGWMTGAVDHDGNTRILNGTVDMGAYEYNSQTADSNGDGVPDGWYSGYGLDPSDPSVGSGNPDNDPYVNADEYILDYNPNVSNDYFRITSVSNNSPFTVYFESSALREYTLMGCTNLTEGVWLPIIGPGAGVGGADSMTDDSNDPANFYKVKVELP